MTYEHILKLIEEHKIIAVKIDDYKGKLILRFDEQTPAQLIHKLTMYQDTLTGYGRVVIQAADENSTKKLWRDSFTWEVEFWSMGNNNKSQAPTHFIQPGMISAAEAELKLELAQLKQEHAFEKRMNELESKMSKKGDDGDLMKYLPLMGLLFKIPEDKLAQMGTLSQVSAALSGKQNTQGTGVNGIGSLKENPELKATPEEEKVYDEIEDEIVNLSGKVELTSIRDFMRSLNSDPALIDKLKILVETFK